MKFPGLTGLLNWLLPCLLVLDASLAGARGLPASEGITNFGKLDAHLFRGAQPDATGIEHLKALGVKFIINLRMPGDVVETEASEARANGINYTNVPLAGLGRPADLEVSKYYRSSKILRGRYLSTASTAATGPVPSPRAIASNRMDGHTGTL